MRSAQQGREYVARKRTPASLFSWVLQSAETCENFLETRNTFYYDMAGVLSQLPQGHAGSSPTSLPLLRVESVIWALSG